MSEKIEVDKAAFHRLVIAARIVAFEDFDESDIRELDCATEQFAALVPWEGE